MVKRADYEIVIYKIKEFLVQLKKSNISFDSVYLYGSYVKGTTHKESDIDVAIIADEWKPDIFDAQFQLMKTAYKIDSRLEPHPFNKEDFNRSNPYAREIVDTGEKIEF